MDIIAAAQSNAALRPDAPALVWRDQRLSHGELWEWSGRLAATLLEQGAPGQPIVVHGHKQPAMVVCFLACVRAGHPYVPVDSSLPAGRVAEIVAAADPALVLAIDPLSDAAAPTWSVERIAQTWAHPTAHPGPERAVAPDQPYYVIFTSGSTGSPKGVQVSRDAVGGFAEWALSLRPEHGPASGADAVYLNQAPFSFDLSVFDLSLALASGATLYLLDKQAIAQPSELAQLLRSAGLTSWVSTPSFADLCLADPEFNSEHLPELELFLFCGETLTRATAAELRRRFPQARVVNSYGPTESTVAVTAIDCTDQVLVRYDVLPVGTPKPGTTILIRDDRGESLPAGERGEIVIVGDTVALGYLGRPDLTAQVFEQIDGQRAYRTGDAGWLADGQLHFAGRLDFQVKLHGYRIEIEDIEANLRRLPGISGAVVVPVRRDSSDAVDHLVAVVQLDGPLPESALRRSVADKKLLRELIPDYMVPKLFRYVSQLPMTANGKVDRRRAERALE